MKTRYKWGIGFVLAVTAAALMPPYPRSLVDYSSPRVRMMQVIGREIEDYAEANKVPPKELRMILGSDVVSAGRHTPLSSIISEKELAEKYVYHPQSWPGTQSPVLMEQQNDQAGRRYGLFEFGEVREIREETQTDTN